MVEAEGPTIRLRRARRADLDRIVELEPVLFGAEAWSEVAYLDEIERPNRHYVVALEHHPGGGERVVGYAGILLGPDAEIMTVGVDPAHRRHGIGRRLVRDLVAVAARAGAERVLLEVRADDPGAQTLYESVGFREIARRRSYYVHIGADAVVMARRLHPDADSVRRSRHLVVPEFAVGEVSGSRPPQVLHVTWDPGVSILPTTTFAEGHVPGAVDVDLERDTTGSSRPDGSRRSLPDPAALQESLQRLGIRAGAPILVVDDRLGVAAAWLWWLLRWAGIEDVRVLDGGLPGWVAAGGAVATGPDAGRPRGDLTLPILHGAPGMPVVGLADVAPLARDGHLVDARLPEDFEGLATALTERGGHVDGAVNAPVTLFMDGHGGMVGSDALRTTFRGLGLDPDRPDHRWAVSCTQGVSSSFVALALTVLGLTPRLWPEGWDAWLAADGPVVRGQGRARATAGTTEKDETGR